MSLETLKRLRDSIVSTNEPIKNGRFLGHPILIIPDQRLGSLDDIMALHEGAEIRHGLWNGRSTSINEKHALVSRDSQAIATYYFLEKYGWCESVTIRYGIILDAPAALSLLHIDGLKMSRYSTSRIFRLGALMAALLTGLDDPIVRKETVRLLQELDQGEGKLKVKGSTITLKL